jgi:hypothetical protein
MTTTSKEIHMDFQEIYTKAVSAAKLAEHEFMQKHGENPYCGFAWVEVTSARIPFVNWCKKNGVGEKHWKRGWSIWNPAGNGTQSMDVKEQGADAFAKVLREHGINAWACSRAD